MNRIIQAAAFAANKHRDQRRKDALAAPYINHPLALAHLLANEVSGIESDDVIIAALLHDTLEDTDTTPDEILDAFGSRVRDIVLEVTDDKSLAKLERKRLQIEHAAALSYEARLVKLADRICNVRDVVVSQPLGWEPARVIDYFDWSKAVVDRLRGTHLELERLFDKAYALRPQI